MERRATETKDDYLWLQSSQQRQQNGKCLLDAVLLSVETCSQKHTCHQHNYRGIIVECDHTQGSRLCFQVIGDVKDSVQRNFVEGDSVIISGMNGLWGILYATIDSILLTKKDGEVLIVLTAASESIETNHLLTLNTSYRIDKYQSFEMTTFLISNLVTFVSHKQAETSVLSLSNTFFSQRGLTQNANNTSMIFPSIYRLREILINGDLPRVDSIFSSINQVMEFVRSTMISSPQNLNLFESVTELLKKCNEDQLRAILLCFNSQDLCVIQGMPGTGKTQVISILILLLVLMNKRVLISSHTHTAIDNILLRLLPFGMI